MSDTAIRVEGLSKRYYLGERSQYTTLAESVLDTVAMPFRTLGALLTGTYKRPQREEVWALKDVSLEVKHGEVVGIIGRNGAGKSTLLKILSRITTPTSGFAEIHGRVGSLLEVGTGFHAELTGRENVYLNGAILGMKRAEIDRKFDDIVAFSEVEQYIDTPVKHYSSGMTVRLAFAVAAHLDPEILLVDEVLAVGDAGFQKKCLGKMGDAAQTGRTVFLVSHNMAVIRQMSDRVYVLHGGELDYVGDADAAIRRYMNRTTSGYQSEAMLDTRDWTPRSFRGRAKIVRVLASDMDDLPTTVVGAGQPFKITLDVEQYEGLGPLVAGVEIRGNDGQPLINLRSDSQGLAFGPYNPGQAVRLTIGVPGIPLYPGDYVVNVWIGVMRARGGREDYLENIMALTVVSQGVFACEKQLQHGRGLVLVDADWSESPIQEPQPVQK